MKIGSLFSGYGGLDRAVMQAFPGSTVAWHCEFDKAPSAILAYHYPNIPNLGDVTKVDWEQVEPVDIITGGSPCQDLSTAGKRAGMTEGTRSNLWVNMREAIAAIKPRLVVWENVQGALSAKAASESDRRDSERHRLCVCSGIDRRGGEHSHRRDEEEVVRPENGARDDEASSKRDDGTSSRVWRDTSDHAPGYREMGGSLDVLRSRGGLREAPAGCDSVFENQETSRRVGHPGKRDQECAATADERPVSVDGSGAGKVPRNQTGSQEAQSQGSRGHCGKCGGCLNEAYSSSDVESGKGFLGGGWTTIRASEVGAPHHRARVFLIAYPADTGCIGLQAARWGGGYGTQVAGSIGGEGTLPELKHLPTLKASDAITGDNPSNARRNEPGITVVSHHFPHLPTTNTMDHLPARDGGIYGRYEPVVRRWETVTGTIAPAPTELNRNGKPRLNVEFASWMMGLPKGWITGVPGLSRAQQIKAIGNGVVPQQAAAALLLLKGV